LASALATRGGGRVDFPLVGVSSCVKCKAVGTIVDMGKCCLIARLVMLGPLWDLPRAPRRTCNTPGRRKVTHG
jgi:hypothetical protein